MRIAIVAPKPPNNVIGGAEMLFESMQNAIVDFTPHQCDLLKITVKENNFWNLLKSYYQFYHLDVSAYDMVISTKYPSWMVQHPNHRVYLVHHLRGLYDTYHLFQKPWKIHDNLRIGLVDDILKITERANPTKEDIDTIFSYLAKLKDNKNDYAGSTYDFPGPFIRQIVHFLDGYALAEKRISKYFTMSDTVRRRDHYFPNTRVVNVLNPPSSLKSLHSADYEYLFTASRLDGPKRIDILIKSMEFIAGDIKLKIAGIGPEEQKLKNLAKKDKRIEFLGYVNEEELSELYSRALAVLFVPFHEDYGLVTIEGMMSRKPIITCEDSGGPLEFVVNGETGYVVPPDPEKIAQKINWLIEHKADAIKIGNKGYERVKEISWPNFVEKLLENNIEGHHKPKKVLVLSTYPCYPPRGGGQHRLFHIYSRLAKDYDVTIYSIVESNKDYKNILLPSGVRQVCIPQSRSHAEQQWSLEQKSGVNLYDICMIDSVFHSEDYVRNATRLMKDADIIIFSHPYLFSLKRFVNPGKIIIYDAIDTEYLLKSKFIKDKKILSKIFSIEQRACIESDLIWSISDGDRQSLAKTYNIPHEKISIVPNGVDIKEIKFIEEDERLASKKVVGLSGHNTILFVGSWHPPNLEAVNFIVTKLAIRFPSWKFLIIGSIKELYLKERGKFPKNVLAFGIVDEIEKYEIYKLADIAVNPMISGSGTNLKMIDYMSAGIPVITTPVGARGLKVRNHIDVIISDLDKFAPRMEELLNDNEEKEAIRMHARILVEENYSWDEIAKAISRQLHSLSRGS